MKKGAPAIAVMAPTGSSVGATTVRAELPDQAALMGLVQRITGLGLEVVDMHLVAPLPEQ